MKYNNKILLILLIAVIFVIGLKVGENHVIRHQSISKVEQGYQVEFDGKNYSYTES